MGRLIAEMPLMNATALTGARALSFSVAVGSAFLEPTSVTMKLTVKMAVMNILALLIGPAKATNSLALTASALHRVGFVMEKVTV